MKRYCVKLLSYKDNKFYVIYLSSGCEDDAIFDAAEFLKNAYGIGTYYLISVEKE